MSCCAFGNSLTLPLVFLLALLPAAAADRATGYLALFMMGWSPMLWTFGLQLLGGSSPPTQPGGPADLCLTFPDESCKEPMAQLVCPPLTPTPLLASPLCLSSPLAFPPCLSPPGLSLLPSLLPLPPLPPLPFAFRPPLASPPLAHLPLSPPFPCLPPLPPPH